MGGIKLILLTSTMYFTVVDYCNCFFLVVNQLIINGEKSVFFFEITPLLHLLFRFRLLICIFSPCCPPNISPISDLGKTFYKTIWIGSAPLWFSTLNSEPLLVFLVSSRQPCSHQRQLSCCDSLPNLTETSPPPSKRSQRVSTQHEMDAAKSVSEPLHGFMVDSVRLVRRCNKPDRKGTC